MEGIRQLPHMRGIIPMAFDHIFGHIRHAGKSTQFLVRASYLEIYNEEIIDLLNPKNRRLEIKESTDVGVYVKNLSSKVINSIEEMEDLMTMGNKSRSVGATEMNATSSRSHSIFSITVEASETDENGEQRIRAGKLHLVDLAGSERQSKTHATGDRLKEATKINLSLSALGNVISSLVDGKSSHIPYRDSKLTRLLQDSLGGNSKTLMIATMSPASYNYEETVSTLRYANRAKNIKNKPKINEDPKDAMLREFQEEIKRLKLLLEADHLAPGDDNDSNEIEGQESGSDKEGANESRKTKRKTSKKKTPNPKLDMEIKAMQEMVKKEKDAILATKDLEESERVKLLAQAEARGKELESERQAKEQVARKLKELEKKVIVGGVNILDQHQQQQIELAKKAHEIEEGIKRQRQLEKDLSLKEELNLQTEERFSSLQEEAAAKTKKLKRLSLMLQEQKSELKDLEAEQQREREDLFETVRELSSQIKLRQAIIQGFIPSEDLQIIYDLSEYDASKEKWRISHVSQAGNNKGRVHGGDEKHVSAISNRWDPMVAFPDPYFSYDVPSLVKKDSKLKSSKLKTKSVKDLQQEAAPQARGLVSRAKRYA